CRRRTEGIPGRRDYPVHPLGLAHWRGDAPFRRGCLTARQERGGRGACRRRPASTCRRPASRPAGPPPPRRRARERTGMTERRRRIRLLYIVSQSVRWIAFEWVAAGLSRDRFDLSFLLLSADPPPLKPYLEALGVSAHHVPY